jgi:uncharacterized membrane protein
LRRSYDGDDAVDESYVVLTIGASLIATLGLLANNAAVVIGAMVVAPWILPLRALVFGSLIGDRKLLFRALITLATGVVITTLLARVISARNNSFLSPIKLPNTMAHMGRIPGATTIARNCTAALLARNPRVAIRLAPIVSTT